MEQIRLTWRPKIVHNTDVLRFTDEWVDATVPAIKEMIVMVEAANAVYGEETHWIERRVASPPLSPRQ